MARKPAHIVAKITIHIPYGQEGVWQVIRELQQGSVKDIRDRVSADPYTVTGYLNRLRKGGFITMSADGWRLVQDQPDAPRLKSDGSPAAETGRGQENMWRSMKMLDRFDSAGLAHAAATPDVTVTVKTAAGYIHRLYQAGYLLLEQPGQPGRKAVYSLRPDMNTGPRAPMIQTTDFVFDPNTRKVLGMGACKTEVSP